MHLDYLESQLQRSQRAARDYALVSAAREHRRAERHRQRRLPRPQRVRAALKKVLA